MTELWKDSCYLSYNSVGVWTNYVAEFSLTPEGCSEHQEVQPHLVDFVLYKLFCAILIHGKYLFDLLKSSMQALEFEGNFEDFRTHYITCVIIIIIPSRKN